MVVFLSIDVEIIFVDVGDEIWLDDSGVLLDLLLFVVVDESVFGYSQA